MTIGTLAERDGRVSAEALEDALREAVETCGRLSNDDVRALRASRRRIATSAAALLVLMATGTAGIREYWPVSASSIRYATSRGEQRTVVLADGSAVRLNGATELDVSLGAHARRVRLARGEAYFDVTHDAARPFVVAADGVSTEVLGTAFDLDRTQAGTELRVYRGAVRFVGSMPGSGNVVVSAGWKSRFRDGAIERPAAFDRTQEDWRQGWIETDGTRLDDVVEALNRTGGPAIVQPTGALASIRVGGRFRLDDPEGLLRSIGRVYGFEVVRDSKALRLQTARG